MFACGQLQSIRKFLARVFVAVQKSRKSRKFKKFKKCWIDTGSSYMLLNMLYGTTQRHPNTCLSICLTGNARKMAIFSIAWFLIMIEARQPLTFEWRPFGYYPLSNIHWRVIRVGETDPRGYSFELWVFSYVGDWDMSASISSLVTRLPLLPVTYMASPSSCGGRWATVSWSGRWEMWWVGWVALCYILHTLLLRHVYKRNHTRKMKNLP
jgi:hypothetical protein